MIWDEVVQEVLEAVVWEVVEVAQAVLPLEEAEGASPVVAHREVVHMEVPVQVGSVQGDPDQAALATDPDQGYTFAALECFGDGLGAREDSPPSFLLSLLS